jgi:hypothetical protein
MYFITELLISAFVSLKLQAENPSRESVEKHHEKYNIKCDWITEVQNASLERFLFNLEFN